MEEIKIDTSSREELKDITARVEDLVREAEIREGVCRVYVPHTTAAVTVNESADPDVRKDILDRLSQLAPKGDGYRHREGNSDAHIKSSLIGNTAQLLIEEGKLATGTWQGVFFCEFDGPRTRRIWVQLAKL